MRRDTETAGGDQGDVCISDRRFFIRSRYMCYPVKSQHMSLPYDARCATGKMLAPSWFSSAILVRRYKEYG